MTPRRRLSELAISETGFVFDPFSGTSFTINATSRLLLAALGRGDAVARLPGLLAEAFDVAPGDDLERDVREFLGVLRDHGLWADGDERA